MTLTPLTIGICCAIFRGCDMAQRPEGPDVTDILTLIISFFAFIFLFFLVAGLLFG